MTERPTLQTKRLILRPFILEDAPEVQRLAGDEAVAATTINLPHPYADGVAEEWIGKQQEQFDQGELVNFAITHRRRHYLIGSIGLTISKKFERAELGYWIGSR